MFSNQYGYGMNTGLDYGYGYTGVDYGCGYGYQGGYGLRGGFTLIVVLFILLIIIGATWCE